MSGDVADPAGGVEQIPLAQLYRPFEGLGNNCEFGIVQRRAGYDPPGLFRNVGFLFPDMMIQAIEARFDRMFDEGHYTFVLPPGWPDWRLDCKLYHVTFHTTIPAALPKDSPEWNRRARETLIVFRRLRQKLLEDMESGEKIFVFRHHAPFDERTARRMHAALRRHGPAWLLYVMQDPEKPFGWVEGRGDGLLLGAIARLSNENPPQIDLPGWEKIARTALAIRARSGGFELPAPPVVPPPLRMPPPPVPWWQTTRHAVSAPEGAKAPLFHIEVGNLKRGVLYRAEASVYIPEDFSGTHVGLVMWGLHSESVAVADTMRRGRWQKIFVVARAPEDRPRVLPSLVVEAPPGSVVYSAGWKLRRIGRPGEPLPAGKSVPEDGA